MSFRVPIDGNPTTGVFHPSQRTRSSAEGLGCHAPVLILKVITIGLGYEFDIVRAAGFKITQSVL